MFGNSGNTVTISVDYFLQLLGQRGNDEELRPVNTEFRKTAKNKEAHEQFRELVHAIHKAFGEEFVRASDILLLDENFDKDWVNEGQKRLVELVRGQINREFGMTTHQIGWALQRASGIELNGLILERSEKKFDGAWFWRVKNA